MRATAPPSRIAGAKRFIHDLANGGGTATVLGAGAEATIDLPSATRRSRSHDVIMKSGLPLGSVKMVGPLPASLRQAKMIVIRRNVILTLLVLRKGNVVLDHVLSQHGERG